MTQLSVRLASNVMCGTCQAHHQFYASDINSRCHDAFLQESPDLAPREVAVGVGIIGPARHSAVMYSAGDFQCHATW
jgi:hypothetical protein